MAKDKKEYWPTKEKDFWKSKKFWAAVIGVMLPALNVWLGLGLAFEEIAASEAAIVAYLTGQGLADLKKNA